MLCLKCIDSKSENLYNSCGSYQHPYGKAKKLLLSTSLSVAEVAEQSGYGDYRVFTKVFKKNEGVTPSQYRRDFLETGE